VRTRAQAVLLGIAALASCTGRTNEPRQPSDHAGQHAERREAEGHRDRDDHERAETHEEDEAHGEHEHAAGADLDRPVETLFAAQCEHEIKAHACDECRYEVGVVKVPASLFAEGLLRRDTAQARAIGVPLRLTGEVRFDERRVAHVSSQAEGIIRRVHVTLGDAVRRGRPLVELDSVAIGEAQAAHLEAQAMLGLSRRSHERLAALRAEGIASEKELLQARQALDAAAIRADAAIGRLTRLGMAAATVRGLTPALATGRLVLRAPTDGTVLKMHAVAGELARSEESLITVGDNSTLWVWADLYEKDLQAVADAQAKTPLAAEVTVRAFADDRFPGTVDLVSPSMSASSRTVKLRVAVDNPGGRLLAGMFAQVDVFLPSGDHRLTVPGGAVLRDEGREFVFVHHEGDYFVRRPVQPGRAFAGLVEIRSGLSAGETVVARGAFLLKSDVLRSKMGAGCAD